MNLGAWSLAGLAEAEDSSAAMRLNGGVAYSGATCGAVTGAAMAVGLLAGSRIPNHRRAKTTARLLVAGTLDAFVAEFQRRRDLVLEGLAQIPGAFARKPEGAFYVMAELPVPSAEEFVIWMLREYREENETVMVAPGDGFYATPGRGKNEIRFAYVLEEKALRKAMRILKGALAAYPAKVPG